jgi:uncharacterized protein YgiM (DUF1202 family)
VVAVVPGSTILWAAGLSADGRWIRVSFEESETQAWAAGLDLTLLGDPQVLPIVTSEYLVASPQPSEDGNEQLLGRVVSERLNVRGGPGLDQPVLQRLAAGDMVTVVGRSERSEWLAIAWPPDRAWVAARYVDVEGSVMELPALAADSTASSTPAPILPGKIVFQTGIGRDIHLVNGDGSGLRKLGQGLDPALSPDGSRVAYARWGSPHGVFVLDLRTGQEQRVASASRPRGPTWSPDGNYLAFSHQTGSSTCLDTPFGCVDLETVRNWLGGEECADTPFGHYCISDFPIRTVEETSLAQVGLVDGSWLDLPSGNSAQSPRFHPLRQEILYRDRQGLQVTTPDGDMRTLAAQLDGGSPDWSPDGEWIAVQMHVHDHTDIFLLDTAGQIRRRLTAPASGARAANNVAPAWSPDGRYVLFLSDRDGSWRLYQMRADGSQMAALLPSVLGSMTLSYEFAAERVAGWGP